MLLALARALMPRAALALSVSAQSELLAKTEELGLPCDAVTTYSSGLGFALGLARVPGLRARLLAQARAHRADAVVSVMTHLWTPLVAPGLTRAGIAFVPILHDAAPHPGDPAALWGWRLRRELAAASSAITLSESVERAMRGFGPDLAMSRMRLGAHLELPALAQGRPDGAQFANEAKPEPDSGPIRLLMFGRLRAYKGLDLLRDAWAMLPPGIFTLRVVGDGPAELLAPGLSALPGVTLETQWVAEADIPALFVQAHAVVLPYREASQSGIIPIALAMGVPVVATPAGGLAEQLRDGVDGLLAGAITAPALAAALLQLTAPGALARLSEGAQASGAGLADWSAQAEVVLRVVEQNRSGAPHH